MTSLRRLSWAIVAAVLAWTTPWFTVVLLAAAPTRGQVGQGNDVSGTITLSPTGLTNGSTLIVGIGTTSSFAAGGYTVSDGTNTYTQRSSAVTTGTNANRRCYIFTADNITTTAGALTITITPSSGTPTGRAQYFEALGATAYDTQNSSGESADGTPHTFGTLTTTADRLLYAIAAASGTMGAFTSTSTPALTEQSGFASSNVISAYNSSATAVSGADMTWTSGTSRTAANCIVSVKTGGGATLPRMGSLLGLIGV